MNKSKTVVAGALALLLVGCAHEEIYRGPVAPTAALECQRAACATNDVEKYVACAIACRRLADSPSLAKVIFSQTKPGDAKTTRFLGTTPPAGNCQTVSTSTSGSIISCDIGK